MYTYNVIAVREVESGDVHASVEHLDEHVSVPTGGSKCADDLGLAHVEVDLLEDVLEANATGIAAAGVCFYHSILTVSSKCVSLVGLCTWTSRVPYSFN